MDKYTKKIKNRMLIRILSSIALLPVAVYTAIVYYTDSGIISGTPVRDFIGGFFNGVRSSIVAGFIIYQIIRIVMDYKALRSEEKLKALKINENDERIIAINEHSSRAAFNIITYVVLAASIVAGLFNGVVSVTLLIAWTFIVLTRFFAAGYYERKL